MGLFSSGCSQCGSKEHSSGNCPHGQFSSKCAKCKSTSHSTSNCPHGQFSSKCAKCKSTSHSTSNCPHGQFSSKCAKCKSTSHSTSNCPHGQFSTKCNNCGSINHSTRNCTQGIFSSWKPKVNSKPSSKGDSALIFFFLKWGFIIVLALFVIMIALFLAPLGLLIWYLLKQREILWIAIVGMIFSFYFVIDLIIGGFITHSVLKIRSTGDEKYIALCYFIIFIVTLGFVIEKYTSLMIPVVKSGNFFEQKSIKDRRFLIVGFCFVLLILFYLKLF